jgi:hypothetical protein
MAKLAEAAQHIDLKERRFRQLVQAGVFKREPRGGYDLAANVAWKEANTRLVDLRYQKESGHLYDRDRRHRRAGLRRRGQRPARADSGYRRRTIQDTWHALMLTVRQTILGLPARIAFDVPTLSAHDRETITETCRTALWDLVLGRGYAVLGTDSGARCDACGGVIPVVDDDEDVRRANEHLVYPDERAKVLGTRSGETKREE